MSPLGALPVKRSEAIGGRSGFTMLELVVSVSILTLLVALLLPAVQQTRESARQTQCISRLRQIGMGIQEHESVHRELPLVGMISTAVLPYLGHKPLYDAVMAVDILNNPSAMPRETPAALKCPSDPLPDHAISYCGNYSTGYQTYGNDGYFDYEKLDHRNSGQVRDGLSNTVAMSEILKSDGTHHRLRAIWELPPRYWNPDELDQAAELCESLPLDPTAYGYYGFRHSRGAPWQRYTTSNAYNHTSTPNRPNCNHGGLIMSIFPAGSFHPGGAYSLYGDGHVAFTSQEIDRYVWRDLGSRIQGAKEPFQ